MKRKEDHVLLIVLPFGPCPIANTSILQTLLTQLAPCFPAIPKIPYCAVYVLTYLSAICFVLTINRTLYQARLVCILVSSHVVVNYGAGEIRGETDAVVL